MIRNRDDEDREDTILEHLSIDILLYTLNILTLPYLLFFGLVSSKCFILVKMILKKQELYLTYLKSGKRCGSVYYSHLCNAGFIGFKSPCDNKKTVFLADERDQRFCYFHVSYSMIKSITIHEHSSYSFSILLKEAVTTRWFSGFTGTVKRLYIDPINHRVSFWDPSNTCLNDANGIIQAQICRMGKKEEVMNESDAMMLLTHDIDKRGFLTNVNQINLDK